MEQKHTISELQDIRENLMKHGYNIITIAFVTALIDELMLEKQRNRELTIRNTRLRSTLEDVNKKLTPGPDWLGDVLKDSND